MSRNARQRARHDSWELLRGLGRLNPWTATRNTHQCSAAQCNITLTLSSTGRKAPSFKFPLSLPGRLTLSRQKFTEKRRMAKIIEMQNPGYEQGESTKQGAREQ